MRHLLILGAGTAGTILANRLRRRLEASDWTVRVVEQDARHYYQSGFLLLVFGVYKASDVVRPGERLLPRGVEYVPGIVQGIAPDRNRVRLQDGRELAYDLLVIATGAHPEPQETEGMLGADWRRRTHEFYSFEGAQALAQALQAWRGGRLVVHVCEFPIKCPVAPLEFAFLADAWLRRRGLRERTELVYVTPLSGAFTQPTARRELGYLLEEKGIVVESDFGIASVDNERHRILSWDGREIAYDLLVTTPVNLGAAMIAASGMGDELNYVATDPHTLQSRGWENIFVIGDATDCPASKAGSVAHFEAEVLTGNVLDYAHGRSLRSRYDGHDNCFVETGGGRAFLLDFNYTLAPVPGRFPFPRLGPLTLLGESRINHWGKLAFRWIYWHVLLKGQPIPFVSPPMSLAGKRIPAEAWRTEPGA
jgi:sulfide:quinone oxidoreductase